VHLACQRTLNPAWQRVRSARPARGENRNRLKS
jgi:hypothetical protein